jgi:hypothetical protein
MFDMTGVTSFDEMNPIVAQLVAPLKSGRSGRPATICHRGLTRLDKNHRHA